MYSLAETKTMNQRSCASLPDNDSWKNETGSSRKQSQFAFNEYSQSAWLKLFCYATFILLSNLAPGHFCPWLTALGTGHYFSESVGEGELGGLRHKFGQFLLCMKFFFSNFCCAWNFFSAIFAVQKCSWKLSKSPPSLPFRSKKVNLSLNRNFTLW